MSLLDGTASPDRDEEAALWCLDLSEGRLPSERQLAFDRWRSDPENYAAFQVAAATWDTVEAVAGAPEIVHLRAGALDSYRRANLRRWQRLRPSRPLFWGAVASLAAAILLMIGWSAMPAGRVFRTTIGERQVAMLEDGSRLSLDAASEVDATFDKQRRTLALVKGRAKFDVAHNPLRPFSVAVGNTLVVATGTSFSVERVGTETRVILFQGHVAILDTSGTAIPAPDGGAIDRQLIPGREVTIPDAAAPNAAVTDVASIRDISQDDTLAWLGGQLSFDDEPLPRAVERMNRYQRDPLVVGNAKAAGVRVNGVFDATDPAAFLDGLRQVSGVRTERKGGKVFLTAR
ncbi:FecR domain-containing protein [Sphingomonas sp. RB3P16]|uniref:FecR family protein n=1 Tax=Parasphingomonas frigoris TaxID=3096163 RepID=UPI002FC6447B